MSNIQAPDLIVGTRVRGRYAHYGLVGTVVRVDETAAYVDFGRGEDDVWAGIGDAWEPVESHEKVSAQVAVEAIVNAYGEGYDLDMLRETIRDHEGDDLLPEEG